MCRSRKNFILFSRLIINILINDFILHRNPYLTAKKFHAVRASATTFLCVDFDENFDTHRRRFHHFILSTHTFIFYDIIFHPRTYRVPNPHTC